MTEVILVSCAGRKLDYPAPAADLYVSTWFRLARAYAEQRGPWPAAGSSRWFILSALYGLLDPARIVAPYNVTLLSMNRTLRQSWASLVLCRLLPELSPGDEVVILAGRAYREPLTGWLRERGYAVAVPMAGLGIGQQQAWLKQNTRLTQS